MVDYQLYSLEDIELKFRGPKHNLKNKEYFVCIGAAQTFGCFCRKPYPLLLEKKVNLPALNLGIGGAGPYYFLKIKELMPYINNARFAIVQVMSGRSESNSLFDSSGGEYLTRLSDGAKLGADAAYKQLLKEKQAYVKEIVTETRQNWVNNFRTLLQEIKIPKVLFWFSNRHSSYQEDYDSVYSLFGSFPQLVNSKMISQIRKDCDEYVECVSNRGRNQLLISRFTNQPATPNAVREDLGYWGSKRYNNYYPSPEMQVDAAIALEKVCRKFSNNAIS